MSGRALQADTPPEVQPSAIRGDVQGALERVNVPSYVYDTHGIIRWINEAARRLVGDVRGRQLTSVVAPEETRRAREAFARHVIGEEDFDIGGQVIGRDGERVSVEVSAVVLYSGHHVVGVFGQVVDVEENVARPPHPHLTPRQAEVLRLLERGHSTHQIARELHLSVETVRNHIRAILRKLGAHSRLEAVALARQAHVAA